MASYNKDIDYAAEVNRIRAADPNANVNALLEAGLAKSKAEYGGKYADSWEKFYKSNYTAPVIKPQIVPQAPQIDIIGNIDALARAKEDALISGFTKSRDSALLNLSDEESAIKPKYYDARNAASAQNQLSRKNFAEFLASRGEAKSGVMDEAVMGADRSLAGQTGLLKRQETADFSNIARRRSGVQNAFESDVANARAGVATTALEQKINELQRQRDIARDDARYADLRSDIEYNRNYQQGRDEIEDARYQQEFELERQRFDLSAQGQQIQNQLAQLELASYPQEQQLRIQQLKAQIAQIGKTPYRSPEEIALDRVKLEMAQEELNALKNPQSSAPIKIQDYYKNILDMKNAVQKQYDQYGSVIGEERKYDNQYIRDYILGLPLTPDEIAYLLNATGIPNVQGPSQFGQ
jgi:hypothetical protein